MGKKTGSREWSKRKVEESRGKRRANTCLEWIRKTSKFCLIWIKKEKRKEKKTELGDNEKKKEKKQNGSCLFENERARCHGDCFSSISLNFVSFWLQMTKTKTKSTNKNFFFFFISTRLVKKNLLVFLFFFSSIETTEGNRKWIEKKEFNLISMKNNRVS